MRRRRWRPVTATVELCELIRSDEPPPRYLLTLTYEVEGELLIADASIDRPLTPGSSVTLEYDSLDPRRNSLNYPRRERRAFLLALWVAAPIVLILLAIAIFGL